MTGAHPDRTDHGPRLHISLDACDLKDPAHDFEAPGALVRALESIDVEEFVQTWVERVLADAAEPRDDDGRALEFLGADKVPCACKTSNIRVLTSACHLGAN